MLKHILIISLVSSSLSVFADDIEIFKRRPTTKPNVIFLMDMSASMAFYADLTPSPELPLNYDANIRYPKVLNGYDPDSLYLANGIWMSGYSALDSISNHALGGIVQRNMQRYQTSFSAIEGCAGMQQDLRQKGFWSYKRSGGGNNTKAKLYTSAKGWATLPVITTNAPLIAIPSTIGYSDPNASDRIVCKDDNPTNGPPEFNFFQAWNWHKSWGQAYIEKVATGNYLNYITARRINQNKFVYSRMSILQDAIYNALGKVKGINIGLARTDGKGIIYSSVHGGGITIPLMPIESAQAVFDKEISTYVPYKYNAISETLYEVMQYLKGDNIKFADGMDYKIVGRNQVLTRHRVGVFPNMYGNVTNYGLLTNKNYQIPSAIRRNSSTYKMPDVKACTNTDVLVFSDGSDFLKGSIFASNSDTEANADIMNLIRNMSFPPGSFLYKHCRSTANSHISPTDKFLSGQCLDELAYYMSHVDQYPTVGAGTAHDEQIIKVHAIGGFLGQNVNNIAYLRQVAKSGKGLFYKADKLVDMRDAIYNAIANTLSVTSTFTMPNVPVSATNRLQDSEDVFLPQFKPESLTNWPGNFKRYKLNDFNQIIDANNNEAIDANGFIKKTAKSVWSSVVDGNEVSKGGMASKLKKNRKVWVNYGNSLSDFENTAVNDSTRKTLMALDGADQAALFDHIKKWVKGVIVSPDNNSTTFDKKSMEDIIHSPPLLVNYASSDPNKPHQTIFVGSNSGFLHALNPDKNNPSERYSFVPKSLFKNFKYYFFNQYAWDKKPYGIDGPITSWHKDTNRNGIIDNGEKAYLFVGMRRGGHSYYALDISKKDEPSLKWIKHGNYPNTTVNKPATAAGYERLGQTWSPLIPAEIMWKGSRKVVLFAGGGYNPVEDNRQGKTRITYDNMGNTLYMIDAATGAVLWDARVNLNNSKMRNSIVAKPVPIDVTGNGLVDMLYASDVGGRIWRFDFNKIHSINDDAGNFAKGGVIAEFSWAANHNHRFFTAPDISYYKGKIRPILISIGSGYRAHPLDTTVYNRHYLIKDTLNPPTTYTAIKGRHLKRIQTEEVSSIKENNTSISNNNAIDANAPYGWKIFLEDKRGEKVLSASTTVKGQVFFSTYSPKETTSAANATDCIPKYGIARLYVVDMHSIGKKKVLVKKLKQSGIPSQPVVLFNRKPKPGTGGGNTGGGNTGGGNTGGTGSTNCEDIGAVTMIGTEVVENGLNRCGQVSSIYWREL